MAPVPILDEVIQEFLKSVHGKGLHPDDAAVDVGVPIESFIALRDSNPHIASAWFRAEEKQLGQLREPQTPLERKHRFSHRFWRLFEPKVLAMVRRIPDDEKGDKTILDLLKHKVIGETLPKESFGQQEITTVVDDPFKRLSTEQLYKLSQKEFAMVVDYKAQVEKAGEAIDALSRSRVIDAEYTASTDKEDGGAASADSAAGRRPSLPLRVGLQAVGGDEHDGEADDDRGSEPVLREDDV